MWQTSGPRAVLTRTRTNFHCDAAHPQFGLLASVLQPVGATNVNLFRVMRRRGEQTMQLVETYERGCDLVASYEPTPPDEVQPSIYCRGRADATTGSEGLEFVISMQTNLLHSDPLVSVSCDLPPGKVLALQANQNWVALNAVQQSADKGDSGVLLFRPDCGNWSYLEAAFPTDFIAIEPATATRGGIAWSRLLFGEQLEKGVIRRARIIGWILPRGNDLTTAVRLWTEFCDSPPPLTA